MSFYEDLDPDMLSQLLDDTRNDPDYLGNPNFSTEAHSAIYQSGPRITFVRTTATGDEAHDPLAAVAIVKVQDHNAWYHPEGTWGRPGMAQTFKVDVVKSQIRMLIGPAEASDGPAFQILITGKDNDHLLANVKKLQERAFEVFKNSMKKAEMRLPFSKVGDYLVVSHKIFAVCNVTLNDPRPSLQIMAGTRPKRRSRDLRRDRQRFGLGIRQTVHFLRGLDFQVQRKCEPISRPKTDTYAFIQ